MKYTVRNLPSFNAVGPGQIANMSMPVNGPVYAGVIFNTKVNGAGVTKDNFGATVERIKLVLNGDPIVDITGAELVMLNEFYGLPSADGFMPLMFSRPEFINEIEERRFALGTNGIRSLVLEVKLASGLTAPELSATAKLLVSAPRPIGQIIRLRSTAYGAQTTGGVREIADLPVVGPEVGRGVKALHISTGAITSYEVWRSGQAIREGAVDLFNLEQDLNAFQTVSRSPQLGWTHVDFAGNYYTGNVGTTNVSDFRLKLTFGGAAPSFTILSEEVVGQPDM